MSTLRYFRRSDIYTQIFAIFYENFNNLKRIAIIIIVSWTGNTLLAAWTPLKERSITATVVYSGGMLGSIFGSSISGLLISNYGWTSVFYWFGGVAIIWCIIFVSSSIS